MAGFMKGGEEAVAAPSLKKEPIATKSSPAALPLSPAKEKYTASPPALKSQSVQRAQPATQSQVNSSVKGADSKQKPAASSKKLSRAKPTSAGILLLEE
jgi:hypothetical protein